jgi:hypothetical protein
MILVIIILTKWFITYCPVLYRKSIENCTARIVPLYINTTNTQFLLIMFYSFYCPLLFADRESQAMFFIYFVDDVNACVV